MNEEGILFLLATTLLLATTDEEINKDSSLFIIL